jgi:hypothetical protein
VGYEIPYTNRAGNPVLTVTNGTGLAEDPRFAGEVVTLRNGEQAHLLPALLWLAADGRTPVALYSETLDAPALMEIAASLSATYEPVLTAPIEPTPAAAVPPPTPMPTPSFAVLRPAWLPEEMTVREQVTGDAVDRMP